LKNLKQERKAVNCKKGASSITYEKERIPRLSSAAAKHKHDGSRQPKSKREKEEKIYLGVEETS
jgi:hypothetical protein